MSMLALVVYRCEINGVPSGTVDLQVRQFADGTIDIESILAEETAESYTNGSEDIVTWPLAAILSVEVSRSQDNGDQVTGAVIHIDEFRNWIKADA